MNELDQLRRLVEARAKATAGPWINETIDSDFRDGQYITGHVIAKSHNYCGNSRGRKDSVTSPDSMTCDDGDFIALAGSTDLQAILAAWERDREELGNARKALSRIAAKPDCKHRPCTNCCDSMEEIRELVFATLNPTPPTTLPKGTQ